MTDEQGETDRESERETGRERERLTDDRRRREGELRRREGELRTARSSRGRTEEANLEKSTLIYTEGMKVIKVEIGN